MSKKDFDLTRREFLLKSTLLSASAATTPFAMNLFAMNAALASTYTATGDYKALVCVYLAGGNDHNNMVLATDGPSMQGYQKARSIGGGATIALPQANLLPLSVTKTDSVGARTFALHPNLTPMQTLFEGGRAAIIANVGPLLRPIPDKTSTYKSIPRPANLFSHSDQTVQWQSTDTNKKNYGWGGRMADLIKLSNPLAQNFTCLSLSGNTAFLAGETISQYQINSNGSPVAISGVGGFDNLFGSSGNVLQPIVQNLSLSNNFELEHAAVVDRAIKAQSNLTTVMSATATTVTAPTQYQNPNQPIGTLSTNNFAKQLQTVARIIAGRNTLGAHRQVFFVALGGFDTHDGQAPSQADLMARLSHAAKYFDDELSKSTFPGGAVADQVTLFTASDFGRTFTSNGDGTDHGWGSHHFVVGGAVRGKDIYGAFPMTAVTGPAGTVNGVTYPAFDNPLDVGSGNFIPQVSVDQYSATMAKWFGLTAGPGSEIASVFPNLTYFDPAATGNLGFYGSKDLGFMKDPITNL